MINKQIIKFQKVFIMKKLLIILISCCFLSGAFAQGITRQVVSPAGGNGTSGSSLLSWTIGETVANLGTSYTATPFFQGFQMPTGYNDTIQYVTLHRGWNYLSTFINTKKTVDAIFDDSGLPWSNASGISVVNRIQGGYNPTPAFPDPEETAFKWDVYSGYQAYVHQTNPVTLTFKGTVVNPAEKTFPEGWSMIPMLIPDKNMWTSDFFAAASVEDKALLIRSIDGHAAIYMAGMTMGNFLMEVGGAYDVFFNEAPSAAVDFTEIAGVAAKAGNAFSYPETPWNIPVANINPHTIGVPAEALASLQYGDVIGAFTADGFCAGMGGYYGQGFAFLVYGMNEAYGIDGFNEDEQMNFRVYRPSTNEVFNLDVDFESSYDDDIFAENGISIVKGVMVVEGIDDYITSVDLYPNPATTVVNLTVKGTFSEDAVAYVFSLEDGKLHSQTPVIANTVINVSNLKSGVYSVKIVDADQVIVKKFVKK